MIIEVRASNTFIFGEPFSFSLKADMRNKRFATNVFQQANINILKAGCVYGANNSGKTCLIKCVSAIRDILNNDTANIKPNMFSGNPVCELGITFLYDGKEYAYDFKYDTDGDKFTFERFANISIMIDLPKRILKKKMSGC